MTNENDRGEDDLVLQGMMVPGHRILVVNDLGPVHKGDHVVMVANVIVSVDTSRQPGDVSLPSSNITNAPSFSRPQTPSQTPPPAARPPQRSFSKRSVVVTSRKIFAIIREHQPISSMLISDQLGFDRDDLLGRAKVTRLLKSMLMEHQIERFPDDRTRLFRYQIFGSSPPPQAEEE